MMTEKGELIVGVEHRGKRHKDFVLRPALVRDEMEAAGEEGEQSDSYIGIQIIAKQIMKLGTIPTADITPGMILDMTSIDFQEIMKAKQALESRLNSFRDQKEEPEKENPGNAETGVSAAGNTAHV